MILASPERIEAVRAAADAVTSEVLELTALISAVPSPTGEETAKSLLVERLFATAGLATERDALGDVVGVIPGQPTSRPGTSRLVVAAHIDTVFPIGTPLEVKRSADRLSGPGVGDNSVAVAAAIKLADLLRIAGVPVGREITDLLPERGKRDDGGGSIIVVVATDAPLLPHQLKRVVRRVSLGVGATGGRGENSSGDIFIAFSTANPEASKVEGVAQLSMLPNERINPLLRATVEATEEAIVNAMVAARTMRGIDGNTVHALPHERLRDVLRKYGRLAR